MTYKEFLEIIDDIREDNEYWDFSGEDIDQFRVAVVTGGASGGNCYGDNAEEFSCNYSEEDFIMKDLNKFFDIYVKNISSSQVDEINEFIEIDTDFDPDYYGNYTNYIVHTISFEKLYDYLKTNSLV